MPRFTYVQNNSFGIYEEDMPVKFTVEADTPEEADTKAEKLGVYFDGVDKGVDCECCGDRWYRAYYGYNSED